MKKYIRLFIQIIFFTLIFLIVINHQLEDQGISIPLIPSLSLHAICPFGGVETFFNLIAYGTFLPKLHSSVIVIFVLVLLSSILFGPLLCSYICPLGSIQEWIGKLGKKIFKKKFNHFVPKKIDSYLRYIRYISLVLVFYLTAKTVSLIFLEVDPYYALLNFYTGEVAMGAIAVLIVTLVSSLFIARPWCKYLCPYGALLGLTNFIRIFPIKRRKSSCIDCKVCDHTCQMNIEVSTKYNIRDHQCISCHDCLSEVSCPVENTVVIEPVFKKEA